MSKGVSNEFSGTSGDYAAIVQQIEFVSNNENTAVVWSHIEGTQPTYPNSVIPRSFNVDTPMGKMWTHGNATEHMYEAASTINRKAPSIVNSNPKMYSQFILYDYWKSLGRAVKNGVRYDRLITEGHWEFKFSPPRKGMTNPVVKHAKFIGL